MPNRLMFDDPDAVRARTAGCPLRATSPTGSLEPCRACPFNVAAPGEARVGCEVDLPSPILLRARAALGAAWADTLGREHVVDVGECPALEARAVDALVALQERTGAADVSGLLQHQDHDVSAVAEVCIWLARLAHAGHVQRQPIRVLG